MESALPYRIPGPAGGISTQPQTQNASPQKPLLDLFRTPPWRQMLAHIKRKIPSSIALLRRNALSNDFMKLSTLPVLIDSLVYVGKDASVLLRDPTGHVRGTIHAEVFRERKGMLERGVVILLNGISALAYIEESRGFRGGDDVVHLSVQSCHVNEVFKGEDTVPIPHLSRPLLDDYEPQARSPKPVVKPPITRLPLREHNYSRPISRGVQSSPRGGGTVRGRGRPSYPYQQSRPPSQHRTHQHPQQRYQHFQRQQNPDPPHYQNMSHQRPMLGSNQHKRPFRPPGMRPNVMETGMSPPQKRPNLRHMQHATRQPRQQSSTVEVITDEQLDSLLGDLDMDAMIAAHGKSTSLPEQGASSVAQKQPHERGKSACPQPVVSSRQREISRSTTLTEKTDSCVVKSSTLEDRAKTDDTTTRRASAVTTGEVQVPAPMSIPGSGPSRDVVNSTAEAAQTSLLYHADGRTISNVDQDMVNNLFSDIDTTDFM